MKEIKLNNIDAEDIEDWLSKVQLSFNIRFEADELANVSTFGELCDCIESKIQLDHSDSCTTQQAFYKLRTAINLVFDIRDITPQTLLTEVLPRKHRIPMMRQLEGELGFETYLLEASGQCILALFVILLISFAGIFINWKIGLPATALSIWGLHLAVKFGKELPVKTVGEAARQIARENYLKCRRVSTTFNRNEIEKILTEWFSHDLSIDKLKLTRDASFV